MVLELRLEVSDSLAQEAKARGLLEASAIERMLRSEIQRARVNQLFAAADVLAAQQPSPLSEAELELEIQAARARRHQVDAGRR